MKKGIARARRRDSDAHIKMTPMIDVVFLLLVFFVLAAKPADLFAHLDVSRVQGGGGTSVAILRIGVGADGYTMNGRTMDLPGMDLVLGKLAEITTASTVLITCERISPHGSLVKALDLCAKHGLENLSVVSR